MYAELSVHYKMLSILYRTLYNVQYIQCGALLRRAYIARWLNAFIYCHSTRNAKYDLELACFRLLTLIPWLYR